MTIGFGKAYEVHVTNGQGSRILLAMGYPLVGTEGSWPLDKMRKGIEKARTVLTDADDLNVLTDLEVLVAEYEIGGETVLEWS